MFQMNFELAAGFERHRAPVAYDWLLIFDTMDERTRRELFSAMAHAGHLERVRPRSRTPATAQLARTYADILIA